MDQIIPAPAPTRTEMGDLSSLTTTQKGSIVGAINEVDADVSTLNSKIATAPVTYTSYADVKSGIASKASTMASGSIASFDFHANYSSAEDLPGAYYTCILRKYDNNSYVADIISNVGADYKLTYAGNTWRITSLSTKYLANVTAATGITILQQNSFYTNGGIKCVELQYQVTSSIAAGSQIFTLPSTLYPAGFIALFSMDTNQGTVVPCYANGSGTVYTRVALAAGYYVITATYG